MKYVIFFIAFISTQISFAQVQTYYVQPTDVNPGYFTDDDSSAIAYNASNQTGKKLNLM